MIEYRDSDAGDAGAPNFQAVSGTIIGGSGNISPLRSIHGQATKLSAPWGIVNIAGELHVASYQTGTILVFAVKARGNFAPLRMLKTLGRGPAGIAVVP